MVAHACNPIIQRQRQEEHPKFEASYVYIVKPFLKKMRETKRKGDINTMKQFRGP